MRGPVVVPLDGSELAESALPHALAIARRAQTPLHLVTVHEFIPPPIGTGFDATHDPRWYLSTGPGQREYLERTAAGLPKTGTDVVVAVLEGSVVPALLGYAEAEGASLLVMATHGRGGLNRMWIGSTLDRTIRETSLPILVVRASTEPAPSPQLSRILLPLDGSPLAEKIVAPALQLGSLFGSAYELLRVVPVPYTVGSGLMTHPVRTDEEVLRRLIAEADRYLSTVKQRLATKAERCSTRVVQASGLAIPEAITQAARSAGADLIALATHGRGGLRRAVLGSVADKLIRSTDLPLLVVRPQLPDKEGIE